MTVSNCQQNKPMQKQRQKQRKNCVIQLFLNNCAKAKSLKYQKILCPISTNGGTGRKGAWGLASRPALRKRMLKRCLATLVEFHPVRRESGHVCTQCYLCSLRFVDYQRLTTYSAGLASFVVQSSTSMTGLTESTVEI